MEIANHEFSPLVHEIKCFPEEHPLDGTRHACTVSRFIVCACTPLSESLHLGLKHCFFCRSYGVLLWEIVTYGELPLRSVSSEEIVNMAENRTLQHTR